MQQDSFLQALVSDRADPIAPQWDWFAPLIGDWDFDYVDGLDQPRARHVQGEWLFRRILEGAGIQDVFICPSRRTRLEHPQPDGEYGLAVRMFNPQEGCYDMVYTFLGSMTRLTFRQEGERLVGRVLERPGECWVFSEMTGRSFRWQNLTVLPDGSGRVNAEVSARRRA